VLQPCVLNECKMATVSAKVFKHHKKADGTFNVKICLYFKGVRKYMDTNHFVSERQLNKRYKVNDKFINTLIEKTLQEYRETISELGGCFGDMLHPIPWQTDHLFCWQRDAAHALAA